MKWPVIINHSQKTPEYHSEIENTVVIGAVKMHHEGSVHP